MSLINIILSTAILSSSYISIQPHYLSSEYTIITTNSPSSQACHDGDIFFIDGKNIKTLFSGKNSSGFYYCSPNIEKISDSEFAITLCYEAGAGSGECAASIYIYNLNNDSWEFVENIYFGFDHTLNSSSGAVKLRDYMIREGYNIKS